MFWQPVQILYPDAELVMCQVTRGLGVGADFVGRALRPGGSHATAVTWLRVGGRDPAALMQCRVYAPTDVAATGLARLLAARLPLAVKLGLGVVAVTQNEGPTDLGPNPGPMRQMLFEIVLQGKTNKPGF